MDLWFFHWGVNGFNPRFQSGFSGRNYAGDSLYESVFSLAGSL